MVKDAPDGVREMYDDLTEAYARVWGENLHVGYWDGPADGATVDTKGNLYITSALGLQVFDASGKFLGTIAIPEQPANVTFGGKDLKTLFVTARTSVYTCPMEVAGHQYPAK